jgi:hypothetical protein
VPNPHSATQPASDDFEPVLHERVLPEEIAARRTRADEDARRLDQAVQPQIDAIVATCRSSLHVVVQMHEQLVERTDLDLTRESRWLAIWEVSGHALALAGAAVDQVEAGHTVAVSGTLRALVETLALSLAMAGGDEQLVRRWLVGKYVSPKHANIGRRQFFARIIGQRNAAGQPVELEAEFRAQRAGLEELGIDPDLGADAVIETIAGRVYGKLSEAAHSTRGNTEVSVSKTLRRFAYGRHPDANVRLRHAVHVATHVSTTILDVGAAIAEIAGMGAVGPHVLRAQERVVNVTSGLIP